MEGVFLTGTDQVDLKLRTRDEEAFVLDGVLLTRFYYNVRNFRGRETWVAAMFGKPSGDGPFPAIVHIHGGGQTVSAEDVAWCVRRGYAAISFDWTGHREERDFITEWGEGVGSCVSMKPLPQANLVYHAVIAARRAITYIGARPEVDADRIGAYGISWGGFTTWLVNGSDFRLKAAVAVYGCGGVLNPGHPVQQETPEEQTNFQRLLYQRCFGPERYAPTQAAPLLFLNGTNDFFGYTRAFADIARLVNVELRCQYTFNYNHHIEPRGAAAAEAFLKMHLAGGDEIPATPECELVRENDGVLYAVVHPAKSKDVKEIMVGYSLSATVDPDKCWRVFRAEKAGDGWRLEIRDDDRAYELAVIADVHYAQGFSLSSIPLVVPMKLAEAPAAPRRDMLWEPGDGLWGWSDGQWGAGTQLYERLVRNELEPDESGGDLCVVCRLAPGVTEMAMGLRRPADPAYQADDLVKGVEIVFDAPGAENLAIYAGKTDMRTEGREFVRSLAPEGDGPHTVRVETGDFVRQDGAVLDGFKDVRVLRIAGTLPKDGEARIYSIKWLR